MLPPSGKSKTNCFFKWSFGLSLLLALVRGRQNEWQVKPIKELRDIASSEWTEILWPVIG
jgi:hypothetical protein